jgi:hypothetical protein
MDGACSTRGRNEKCIQKLWSENLRGNLDVDTVRIDLTQNRPGRCEVD